MAIRLIDPMTIHVDLCRFRLVGMHQHSTISGWNVSGAHCLKSLRINSAHHDFDHIEKVGDLG